MRKITLYETFAGIGAQRRALEEMKDIEVHSVGICEWNPIAILSYFHLHEQNIIRRLRSTGGGQQQSHDNKSLLDSSLDFSKNVKSIASIKNKLGSHLFLTFCNLLKQEQVNLDIRRLEAGIFLKEDRVDIFTYSFPCQSISNASSAHKKQIGFEKKSKSKSSLVWEVARLLRQIKYSNAHKLPRTLLMENVSTILSKKFISTFEAWLNTLRKLGYVSHVIKVNSRKHGHPQNRLRVFCISYLNQELKDLSLQNDYIVRERMYKKTAIFYKYDEGFKKKNLSLNGYLCLGKEYDEEANFAQPNLTGSRKLMYYKGKKLYILPTNLPRRTRLIKELHESRKKLSFGRQQNYVNTITTKQDRYPNAGIIEFDKVKNFFRFLTPRETLLLMGFRNNDYDNLISVGIKPGWIYILSGNSIVVPTMQIIMKILLNNMEEVH